MILGIGNPILTDDALGLLITRRLYRDLPGRYRDSLDFIEENTCGINLLDSIAGYTGVCFIDSFISESHAPGTCLDFDLNSREIRRYHRFFKSHGLGLADLWELGRKLGLAIPGECLILGIVAGDLEHFGEGLSAELSEMFDDIMKVVIRKIIRWLETIDAGAKKNSGGEYEKACR